jgi:hypothetical protein
LLLRFFAYGTLAPVDCNGLSAEIEAAHAKVGQQANLASVGGTTQRKTHRAVGGLVTSRKRASIVSSKSPRGRQPAVKQNHKIRLGANREAARVQKRNRLLRAKDLPNRMLRCLDLPASEDTKTASGERFDKHELDAAAVWHAPARDKCQEWAVCDRAGQ